MNVKISNGKDEQATPNSAYSLDPVFDLQVDREFYEMSIVA